VDHESREDAEGRHEIRAAGDIGDGFGVDRMEGEDRAVKNAGSGFFQISSASSHASITFAMWSARFTAWYPLARSPLPSST